MGCIWCKAAPVHFAAPSGTFTKKYTITKILGTGRYGEVYECMQQGTDKTFAVKVITRRNLRTEYENEVLSVMDILTGIRDPHVIRVTDVIAEPRHIFVLMEHCQGGLLYPALQHRREAGQPLCEAEVRGAVRSLFEALRCLHGHGVVHRDIKLETLLLPCGDSACGDVKVAGFGLAIRVDEWRVLMRFCGTLRYMAPEKLHRRPYGKPADVWSAGMCAYILLGGDRLFEEETPHRVVRRIMHEGDLGLQREAWGALSEEAKDWLRSVLVLDPDKRPTAKQALEHPWLSDGGKSPDVGEAPRQGARKARQLGRRRSSSRDGGKLGAEAATPTQ